MNKSEISRQWARATIQSAGLRVTSARLATLLVMRDAKSPLTHAEVTARLVDSECDKATVFRNLSDLVSAGLLRRSEFGDHAWRFEMIAKKEQGHGSHPHFVCVDCGNVSCLEEIELTQQSKLVSEQFGRVTEILLRGRCHDCS